MDRGHAAEYERRANEYEDKAKRVTDPWVKERYLTLAKRCPEMNIVLDQKGVHSNISGS
jgi:hypothetical protein